MENDKKPEILSFGPGNGPHLVVTGAVHGNETCGPAAISRALQCLKDGRIEITHGTVMFVPVANPRAYQQGVRFVERNLNRMMFPKDKPLHYEDHLDNVLCPLLDQADVLLDLHSFNAEGEAFVFLGPPKKADAEYARALGVRNFMHGFAESYAASKPASQDPVDPRASQGTTEYARLNGAMAVTLECGSHKDPEAVEVGFQAILNALEYHGLADIAPDLFDPRPVSKGGARAVRLTEVFYKTEEGRFAKPWVNMSAVKKGELLATFNSGATIIAPDDGFIVMPKEDEKVGLEWFHFGVVSDYFKKLGM